MKKIEIEPVWDILIKSIWLAVFVTAVLGALHLMEKADDARFPDRHVIE